MSSYLKDVFLNCAGLEFEDLETTGTVVAQWQRGANWWIGDLARYAEARWPDRWQQVFPEWISPGLVDRCKAVAKAYPAETDRNIHATWTIHAREANKPDRVERVAAHVEAGRTSDEAREANQRDNSRWLLAIDVNYYVHRYWHSGAGIEAATSVAGWVQRTVERLKLKGLTDCVCCFDSKVNHRKELTAEWDDRYKDRPLKDPELGKQLDYVTDLLKGYGFACVHVEGMEADDVMASYAAQFDGRVTLLTQDKDLRQCLSGKCNILLDVEWVENGDAVEPEYKWLSSQQHTEATGLTPRQWVEYQCLMGDAVDGIKGAIGIGEKGAKDLVQLYGSAAAAIEAAKMGDERIKPKKREALIEFEGKLETTRKLVTMRADLELPSATRIA